MTVPIVIECDTTWAVRLASLACRLHPVIGVVRAWRLARWCAYRLSRWRVAGTKRWTRGIPLDPQWQRDHTEASL